MIAFAIWIFCSVVYWLSPVSQIANQDPKLELFTAYTIWKHRSLALDPWLPEDERGSWRTIEIGGRTYLYFPLGTAVLSIPFVAAVDLLGGRIAAPNGTYDLAAEIRWQRVWTAMLAASVAVMFFLIARSRLPDPHSAALAVLAAFGTQLWSTAALGLWVDTMGTVLLTAAVLHVWRADFGGGRIAPWWLGTLLSWLYFVRPTYALAILCLTGLAVGRAPLACLRLAACGGLWLAAFVTFSLHVFGTFQPPYYAAGRIEPQHVIAGICGHVFSPSRSFLLFWPALPFVLWLLWRCRDRVTGVRWLTAAAVALAAQIWIHSAQRHWWGGGSYGSRYTLGTVPWYFTTAVIAIAAARGRWSAGARAVGATLCAASVFLHARGALSQATQDWYEGIDNSNAHRLWDWREPQFLAGLVPRPIPASATDIHKLDHATDAAFGPGWSDLEEDAFRWTNATRAEIHFSATPDSDGTLVLDAAPYLGGGALRSQRVIAMLRRRKVLETALDRPGRQILRIPLDHLGTTNRLTLLLPDAASPLDTEQGSRDARRLALQIFGIRFEPAR